MHRKITKVANLKFSTNDLDRIDLDKTIRERKMWAKLDNDFFVQYRSSWVELSDERVLKQFLSQEQFQSGSQPKDAVDGADHKIYAILHIQMDLCPLTLKKALDQLKDYFQIQSRSQVLPPLGYYISCELLVEILDCIQFLHKHSILHRDINPNNIMIRPTHNSRFVRIADFGGAVEHMPDMTHTRMYGTLRYMAPEVANSSKYDTSADVYSIGVMTQEMFNFDINV